MGLGPDGVRMAGRSPLTHRVKMNTLGGSWPRFAQLWGPLAQPCPLLAGNYGVVYAPIDSRGLLFQVELAAAAEEVAGGHQVVFGSFTAMDPISPVLAQELKL